MSHRKIIGNLLKFFIKTVDSSLFLLVGAYDLEWYDASDL